MFQARCAQKVSHFYAALNELIPGSSLDLIYITISWIDINYAILKESEVTSAHEIGNETHGDP
jgi:hypothetical protein